MGSKTFDGVRFAAFSHDHPPPHVHGHYAGIVVIVQLKDGIVEIADRSNNVIPANAKRSDVVYVVKTAEKYAEQLIQLWESARG